LVINSSGLFVGLVSGKESDKGSVNEGDFVKEEYGF